MSEHPELTPPPPPPVRGVDSEEEFATKANDMMAYLPVLQSDLTAVVQYINDQQIDLAIQKIDNAQQLLDDLEYAVSNTNGQQSLTGALTGVNNSVFNVARLGNMRMVSLVINTQNLNSSGGPETSYDNIFNEAIATGDRPTNRVYYKTTNGESDGTPQASAGVVIRPDGTVDLNEYVSTINEHATLIASFIYSV